MNTLKSMFTLIFKFIGEFLTLILSFVFLILILLASGLFGRDENEESNFGEFAFKVIILIGIAGAAIVAAYAYQQLVLR